MRYTIQTIQNMQKSVTMTVLTIHVDSTVAITYRLKKNKPFPPKENALYSLNTRIIGLCHKNRSIIAPIYFALGQSSDRIQTNHVFQINK